MPDFSYAIFEEISGISRKDFGRRLSENDFVQQEIARLKEKAEKIMKRIEELEKRKKVKG